MSHPTVNLDNINKPNGTIIATPPIPTPPEPTAEERLAALVTALADAQSLEEVRAAAAAAGGAV